MQKKRVMLYELVMALLAASLLFYLSCSLTSPSFLKRILDDLDCALSILDIISITLVCHIYFSDTLSFVYML
jgi:hypothetical protein